MKTPIEPSEIRTGDTIRIEWKRDQCGSPRALEYVALSDGMKMRRKLSAREFDGATHYLLDRPTPSVELPTEPTLGFVRTPLTGSRVAFIGMRRSRAGHGDSWVDYLNGDWNTVEHVTAFTPASAVPTSALDELRSHDATSISYKSDTAALQAFLAAVDAANEATS